MSRTDSVDTRDPQCEREKKKWCRSEDSDMRDGVRQTDSILISNIRGQFRQ